MRFYGNSKVKRFLAWLILVSTVLTSFIASDTEIAYADSNSRRMTSINLAAGIGFGDISDIDSIDEISMQTIAIYLSNFYLPFVTILDGDYTKEGAEDSGNTQHVQAMKDALVRNCGFKKDVADYLVGYVLNQSLASCKTVYMKKTDLRSCFRRTQYPADSGHSYLGFSNGSYTTEDASASDSWISGFADLDGQPYIDAIRDIWKKSAIYYTRAVVKPAGFFSSAEYGEWDYITTVGAVTVNGVDYVPVSYAIFLGVMANARLDWEDGDTSIVEELGDYEFYTLLSDDNGLTMAPVFSNNYTCSNMLLQALQYCDVENGFSNGFASISGTDVESINNPEATQYSLVCAPNLYVNWEGSLIFDNGVYRTVVLPGCMNPYMVTSCKATYETEWITVELDDSRVEKNALGYTFAATNGDKIIIVDGLRFEGYEENGKLKVRDRKPSGEFKIGTKWPLINNTSLSSLGLGLTDSDHVISFASSAFSNYRVMIGADQDNFDQNWKPGTWGENDSIFELLESMNYVEVEGVTGEDYARFPILSSMYDSDDITLCDGNKKFVNLKARSSSTEGRYIVYYDSLTPITAETTLNQLFKTQDVFDDTFVEELRKYNIDTYAQFKNIKKQGHALSYPKSTQKLFQQIYITYCFAAFNADAESYTPEVNIVPIKFNFANFPKGNIDLDWSSIQQDQLANEVMSFVYYLLHPTEGVAYVTRLFKNKVSGILLGWHEDIVGGTSSNSATGMTKYLGTSSYTTMPSLKDISWVSGLLNIYNNIVVYLIILMCLILLCYVLTGSMTIQRGIVGVVIFGICAFLPPVAINAAVDTINTTSDSIFSKKFDFWAICQMQTFLDDYQKAMEAQGSGDFSSYAAFVIGNTKSDVSLAEDDDSASAVSFSGAKLKWMAPKKYNSLASLVQAVNEGTAMGNSSASFLKNSLLSMVAKSTSGETYLEDSESLYLYRDYSDIFKYAHTSYNIWGTFNYSDKLGQDGDSWNMNKMPLRVYITSEDDSSYLKAWSGISNTSVPMQFVNSAISTTLTDSALSETSSVAHISKGYLYNTLGYEPREMYTNYKYLWEWSGDPEFASRNTLAVSYLANYMQTYREVADARKRLNEVVMGTVSAQVGSPSNSNAYYNFGLPKAAKDAAMNGSYMLGYQEIIGLEDAELPTENDKVAKTYKDLSDIFYGLYSESPFFYFNANVRDQANAAGTGYSYDFNDLGKGKQTGGDGKMNSVAKMFLKNNQEYFFNLSDNAGDGYGELRDFTNMHDFFYFVIPFLREGVELARLYDDVFGLYVDEDCSLIVNADGSIGYDGQPFKDLNELGAMLSAAGDKYTEEELYKLWHSYNTYTILSAYTPWIDTMLDCDYSRPETIHVLGDKFKVNDPLNPRSYYRTDESGKLVEGRYMVFSKSEMNAMGLTTADLTEVERKIIQFQDKVYNETLNLMNYYTFSDEVMVQAYAMLQTFEFNKLFSQTSPVSQGYVMYPQGYELKAFSYDAYLRMIVSGASGESLMFNGSDESRGNVSIYERVMKNTSLFFGIFLLLNDILAVYLIPGLKVFFLVAIFICSILILVGSVIKMEMNIFAVLWKSLLSPLLAFSAICIGLSLIVSMFMHTGANGVSSTEFIISMGDPTSAIILMIILNVLVVVLMFKIVKKCIKDLITYGKAVFDNIGSTVVGAVGAVGAGFAAGRAMDKFGGKNKGGSGVSRTAKQRGHDNDPRSGKNGVASSLAAGAAGGAVAAGAAGSMMAGAEYDSMSERDKRQLQDKKLRSEDTVGMNKYDRKAYEGATAKQDIARDKAARDAELAQNAKGLRKKRYEMAQKLHERQANSAAIKADNVKKYGTGARSRIEGMKTIVGGGRKTRLAEIDKARKDRVSALEKRSSDALQKQATMQGVANASATAKVKRGARRQPVYQAKKGTSKKNSRGTKFDAGNRKQGRKQRYQKAKGNRTQKPVKVPKAAPKK